MEFPVRKPHAPFALSRSDRSRQMISILDRYLLREVLKMLLALLSVLVLVLLATMFIRYLGRVARGDVAAHILLELVGLELLRNLSVLIPPAFFFAILISLGRMHRNNELVVLEACGLGPLRIFRSVMVASLPVALLVTWLAAWVLPWGNQQMSQARQSSRNQAVELSLIEAGRFNEHSDGDLVFYVAELDPQRQTMHDIFVQNREHGKIGLVVAAGGRRRVDPVTGDSYLVLENGTRYEGEAGSRNYRIGSFDAYSLRVGRDSDQPVQPVRRKELPTAELLRSADVENQAEGQYRMMQPLAVLAFALLSIPLTRSRPRQGMAGRMLTAFLVYFVFLNLLGVSQNLMRSGDTPVWLGLWWVPLCMLLLGLGLMGLDTATGRALRRRWLRMSRW